MAAPLKKVLIVDDDSVFLDSYGIVLEAEGFKVMRAKTGKEGLEIAKKQHPKIIVLDLLMPGMDGFEFLKSYRAGKPEDTHVIVLSNITSAETAKSATDLGALLSFSKSTMTPKQLSKIIKALSGQ